MSYNRFAVDYAIVSDVGNSKISSNRYKIL